MAMNAGTVREYYCADNVTLASTDEGTSFRTGGDKTSLVRLSFAFVQVSAVLCNVYWFDNIATLRHWLAQP
jgi:hypothetical protein